MTCHPFYTWTRCYTSHLIVFPNVENLNTPRKRNNWHRVMLKKKNKCIYFHTNFQLHFTVGVAFFNLHNVPLPCGMYTPTFCMSHFQPIWTINRVKKQDCIPVGCIPPTCWLYLPACTVQGGLHLGGAWSQGVSTLGGVCSRGCLLGWVPAPRGVPGPGGWYPSMH